jgi:hypothetical protein
VWVSTHNTNGKRRERNKFRKRKRAEGKSKMRRRWKKRGNIGRRRKEEGCIWGGEAKCGGACERTEKEENKIIENVVHGRDNDETEEEDMRKRTR